MPNGIFGRKTTELDEARRQVLDRMRDVDVESDEWKELFQHVEKFTVLKAAEGRDKVSPDTLAMVAGNLVGILIIVGYEHGHVLVSRGLSFLLRPGSK